MIPRVKTSRYVVLVLTLCVPWSTHAGFDDWLKQQLKQVNQGASLDAETVTAGLREALENGTARAVQTLGRENGFWSHAQLRIPMPEKLHSTEKALRRLGQDKLADDFLQSLNRAAEQATPAAREIFVGAIREMSIRDAMAILKGPSDAATEYFRQHTDAALTSAFRPIVERSTDAVGVTARYKTMVKRLEPFGLVAAREFDLDDYVTRKALDGLFQLVAEEEARIRRDPVARTTDLLRQVFR
jgi:hypothetical protein